MSLRDPVYVTEIYNAYSNHFGGHLVYESPLQLVSECGILSHGCCDVKNKMPILSDNSYIRQETERRVQCLVITRNKSSQYAYTYCS